MPQFDPAVFAPQLIWLAVFFVLLYGLMAKLALPRVDRVLAARRERIEGNLARADALRAEAERILAAYQKAISDAKASAQADLANAAAESAAAAGARESAFARALAEKTATAEAAIEAGKKRAMLEASQIAADLAGGMTRKLAGLSPRAEEVASAVRAAQSALPARQES